jgi:hypothetical protein
VREKRKPVCRYGVCFPSGRHLVAFRAVYINSYLYVSEKGVRRSVPVLRDGFFLKTGSGRRHLGPSSTCYQFFLTGSAKVMQASGRKKGNTNLTAVR